MTVLDLLWFLRKSWHYLGCDQGSGRWRARRRYLTGLPGAWRKFHRAAVQDRRDAA